MWYEWPRYVPVAERRHKAERERQKALKRGQSLQPVAIAGRKIAHTFWGQSWCRNLERYSDYSNRLPRGRTYVRNGSVIDLQVTPGNVQARVMGSSLYNVAVKVAGLPAARWSALRADCAGAIDSLVELLQGRFSKGVMERICRPTTGLFPAPQEIVFTCSCPDWAAMCKHVAAVLYGIGARLDERPELLFTLRQVEAHDLVSAAAQGLPLSKRGPGREKVLADEGLSELFGLELGGAADEAAPDATAKPKARRTATPAAKRKSGQATTPPPRAKRAAAAAKPKPTAKRTKAQPASTRPTRAASKSKPRR